MKKRTIDLTITLAVLITLYFLINDKSGSKEIVKLISEDSLTTFGQVTDIKYIYRHGYQVTYKYQYKDNELTASITSGHYEEVKNLVLLKSFPVVFKESNPQKSYILILESDFSMFGRSYPDSIARIFKKH
jgi:hypothetical protein